MKAVKHLRVAVLTMVCSFCITGCEQPDIDEELREVNTFALILNAISQANSDANRCGPPQNPAQRIEVNTEYVFQGPVCLAVTTNAPAEIRLTQSDNQGGGLVIYDDSGSEIMNSFAAEGSIVSLDLADAVQDLRIRATSDSHIDYTLEVIE